MRNSCEEDGRSALLRGVGWALARLTLGALVLSAPIGARAALSGQDSAILLGAHNDARARVAAGQLGSQPAAANMARLEWDPTLARVAQAWADRCDFAHNPNARAEHEALGGARGLVGENLYAQSFAATAGANAVGAWVAEQSAYRFGAPFSADTGHYTQVVWAVTRRVGCGQARCPALFGASRSDAQLVVCNYAPAGNVLGQEPYQRGAAASACPRDLPRSESGLCTAPAPAVPLLGVSGRLALGAALGLLLLGTSPASRRSAARRRRAA